MTRVAIAIEGAPELEVLSLTSTERIGEASRFDVELAGPPEIAPASVLEKACVISFEDGSRRRVAGVCARFAVAARAEGSRYRATVASRFALLDLDPASRVFVDCDAVAIVEALMKEAGYAVARRSSKAHAARPLTVQYQETSAAFARRLCEAGGLRFRFEPADRGELCVIEDDAPATADEPALLAIASSFEAGEGALATSVRRSSAGATFTTNTASLAPGMVVSLAADPGYRGSVSAAGDWLVTGVEMRWSTGGVARADVEAAPREAPFRLPAVTARPTMMGLHRAVVTAVERGSTRARVCFPWDPAGASTPPIPTLQTSAPGSRIVPDVGREVLVAFLEGDPERPVIAGGTLGAADDGAATSIVIDAASGTTVRIDRARVTFEAPNDLREEASASSSATARNEARHIGGDARLEVGGGAETTARLGIDESAASHELHVGQGHYRSTTGDFAVEVASHRATIAGSMTERIGDGAQGAASLLAALSLKRAGARSTPGAIISATEPARRQPPWDLGRAPEPTPAVPTNAVDGRREERAGSSHLEIVAGASSFTTPGFFTVSSEGPATTLVSGTHTTRAARALTRVSGDLGESFGALHVNARGASATRVTGALERVIERALESRAGGDHRIAADRSIALRSGTFAISSESIVTFKCGASTLRASPSGVFVETETLRVTGRGAQSGTMRIA